MLTPSGEPHLQRLAILFNEGNSLTSAMTYTENGSMAVAEVVESMANSTLNGSVCNISSLEVYRGSSQAIEIRHSGFTLNENGNIVVSDLHSSHILH